MTSDRLGVVRVIMLGGTGALCVLYAILAVVTGRPDPLPFWITGVVGLIAALVIWLAALAAGPKVAGQTFDEGYRADTRRAQSFGFWVAIWLYPVFGVLLWLGLVEWSVAFASMGCLTAASYLVAVIVLDMEGRA